MHVAANGADGQNKRCSGRVGESLHIRVPRGTLLRDADSGAIMHDMSSASCLWRRAAARRLGQPALCHPDAAGAALCQARPAG